MFRSALALLLALALPAMALADNGKPLRIGITLHPYYSYVTNIVGDKAEVVPLIPAGFNPTPTNHGPRTSSASAPWMWWCSTVSATTTSPTA